MSASRISVHQHSSTALAWSMLPEQWSRVADWASLMSFCVDQLC